MAGEIRVELRQVGASTSEATMGPHQVRIDRPVEKGGADVGPMGGQLFLAAVGGCFMSNLLAAIRAREAPVREVWAEVVGMVADNPSRFESLDVRVSAESDDRELVARLVEIADRGCIMMNTLRGKVPVRIRVA